MNTYRLEHGLPASGGCDGSLSVRMGAWCPMEVFGNGGGVHGLGADRTLPCPARIAFLADE
jgi:hypothetical protein